MSQSYYQIWVHLVWATHCRQPLLVKPVRIKLINQIRHISVENEYHLDTINGVEDHLHCLYSLQPKQTISKVVKDIKGASSHWVNANNLITEYFNWQDGYAAFSVSYKNVPFLRKYIYEQEKHHTKISFEDEIKKLREDGII